MINDAATFFLCSKKKTPGYETNGHCRRRHSFGAGSSETRLLFLIRSIFYLVARTSHSVKETEKEICFAIVRLKFVVSF